MNRSRWCSHFLLAGVVLAALAFTACDSSTDSDPADDVATREQKVDLEDAYGGFNTADEAPAFNDPYLISNYGADGTLAVSDNVDTTHVDRRGPLFLMITWGNLHDDSTVTTATDWTGGLCSDNGVIRAVRTIRFERADHLVPRSSRACIEWVSHTQPDFDGVIVALFKTNECDSLTDPALADTLCEKPLAVTFTTGPLTITFSQEELVNLHRVITLDDGNAVAFNVITSRPDHCPQGFLAGQWRPAPERKDNGVQGYFRGQWVTENGLHRGHLRGVYGVNRHDEHVFFGKWIVESGRFHGLLIGKYGREERTDTGENGWFEGVWMSRSLAAVGGVRGVWGTGDDSKDGGFFRGAWRQRCFH